MNMRMITCTVRDEHILGDGVCVGAAGSHNDVALALTFHKNWDGLGKAVTFFDALKESATLTVLTDDMRDEGGAYILPIPREAKKHAGEIRMTVRGVEVGTDEDGNEVTTGIAMTATAYFKVLESDFDEDALASVEVPASVAEQLLADAAATRAIADTVRLAAESGEFDGKDYVLTEADKTEIAEEAAKNCVAKGTETNAVYARGTSDTMIPFASGSAEAYTMVRRDSRGCIISNTPVLENECATKGYVDNAVGDVEEALDVILALQESYIGGEGA